MCECVNVRMCKCANVQMRCECAVKIFKSLLYLHILTFSHLHISYSPAFLILPSFMSLANSFLALASWALKASLA